MVSRIDVTGTGHITAGGNVNISRTNIEKDLIGIEEIFVIADESFRSNVDESGLIYRGDEKVKYSSKELFTSLMQICIPFEASIRIPFQIVNILSDIKEYDEDKVVTTSDIRIAVVQCIGGLVYLNHTEEEVNMWTAAYIRRYGNPGNDFLIVIDNGQEKQLNHEYAQTVLIPHLLRRTIGPNECQVPQNSYPAIFSSTQIERMSREILRFVSVLNLYTIRYKTLIHLLQDLVLQPPHPWIVNKDTQRFAILYNIDRANHHLKLIIDSRNINNPALFNQAARECFMHLCAIILSYYGAFLGVNTRYGLLELIRLLRMKRKNPALWSYCNISEIDDDLKPLGCCAYSMVCRLERINHNLMGSDGADKFESLSNAARELAEIVVEICDIPQAKDKLGRTLRAKHRS